MAESAPALCGRLRLPCRCCGRLLSRGLFLRGTTRKSWDTDVVTRLTNNVSKLIRDIKSRHRTSPGWRTIKLEGHEALHFDHVVLATQANQALDLVAPEFKRARHPRKVPIRIKSRTMTETPPRSQIETRLVAGELYPKRGQRQANGNHLDESGATVAENRRTSSRPGTRSLSHTPTFS